MGLLPLPPEDAKERSQSGGVRLGRYFDNPDPALSSRPDGSGAAENFLRVFVSDVARGGDKGLLADAVFLTDRHGGTFQASSIDYLLGVSLGRKGGQLQIDRREAKHLDRSGDGFRVWDVRFVFPFSSGEGSSSGMRQRSKRSDVYVPGWRGAFVLGNYLHNRSLPARHDWTGLAYMRYAFRIATRWREPDMGIFVEGDFLTDKGHSRFKPVQLDLAYGISATVRGLEWRLIRQSSEILDGAGSSSAYLLTVGFPLGGS